MTNPAGPMFDLSEIEALFTRTDGSFLCARWGRPLAPIVFGVEDETLSVFKGAFEALCALSGHKMAETDPELGANVMVFVFRDWSEVLEVPDLDRMVPELIALAPRLKKEGASQYRQFRFDEAGGIKACFVFLCLTDEMAEMPVETLSLIQVVQIMLTWSEGAFGERSPLGVLENGSVILRPEVAGLLRAAYDPVLPVAALDKTHAFRLSARLMQAPTAH